MLHTVLAWPLGMAVRPACRSRHRFPQRLSGGWKRRVACAAAMSSSASAWLAFGAGSTAECEGGDAPSAHDPLRVDDPLLVDDPLRIGRRDGAKLDLDGERGEDCVHVAHEDAVSSERPEGDAANEAEEGRVRANIERMEAAVQLASGPWPQHPWRAARAIENRLLRVQLATRDLEVDAVGQAVLASQAWSETLQTASGADPGGRHDHPWLLYSAFGLGVVACIAGAYRVRGTVPGTVGQITKARVEAAMAREKPSAPAVPKPAAEVAAQPPTQPVAVPEPQPDDDDDGPPSLLAKLDDLPSRGKRTAIVQESAPLATWQRAAWEQPRVAAASTPIQSVTVRRPQASDGSSLLARLDASPSRAERAMHVQGPTAELASAKHAGYGNGAGAHRQSKPRGGNHELV